MREFWDQKTYFTGDKHTAIGSWQGVSNEILWILAAQSSVKVLEDKVGSSKKFARLIPMHLFYYK